MSRRERDKGKRIERALATILRERGYADIRRGWQSRVGSDDPDIVGVPGWWIECAGGAHPSPAGKYAQALEAVAGRDIRPVAITHHDRGEWLATVALEEWLRLIAIAVGHDAARREP